MVGAYKLLFNGDPVLGAGPLVDVVVSCQLLIALIYCIPCIVAQSSVESGWRGMAPCPVPLCDACHCRGFNKNPPP